MKRQAYGAQGIVVTGLVFLVVLLTLVLGLSRVDEGSNTAEAAALEAAVRRAVVLCYSVEGRYPSSVKELCEHYGLTYNHDRFIISLDSFASNLLPDIRVLMVGGKAL